ncbi:methylase [Clostridium chromiireducens]|uniref:site-specific DNA-methyltransferase (adenine-specific) n=1 Tax=Clostridium chromiireducens TaxID=225345 RepID=A0A964RST3_9CLOT|nr:class I SAM-dependent DNA methyltransferase [Clostridium chromiireducens]MVX67023.1 methylase [Clostridium chromiireducens]
MTDAQQREAARKFANTWRNKGYEKGDTQRFWIALLSDVLGIENIVDRIEFEKEVIIGGQTKFIDGYIPETRVLIEQKSIGKDLFKAYPQSGGILKTPYEQAKDYAHNLPVDEMPRWIITCNFKEFYIYDMNKPNAEPIKVLLENLREETYLFDFLIKKETKTISREMELSIQAGEIVGLLYDALLAQYKDPSNEETLKSLNMLCVRIVFCLYAEDAGLFGKHSMFGDYLERFEVRDFRYALMTLFKVLDTKIEDRDPYMDEELAKFPYVNGGLFAEEHVEMPQFTEEIKELLLEKASSKFNWSEISPTIFGAVFESTLNPETRRSGGMHYTSIENIHKVTDPLFLDDLNEEFERILSYKTLDIKKQKLDEFHHKLSTLNFLDPACGSGNFLTETYLSLRRIENLVLETKIELTSRQISGQIIFGDWGSGNSPIKVSIKQFYGIEINDFATTVARTALWIAESQMMKETEDVVHINLNFLPLKSYANIVEADALEINWSNVIGKHNISYIMGNPPFIGARLMEQGSIQKGQVEEVFGKIKDVQDLDYVTCWYKKAAEYIQGTRIEVGFVATNSICQGSQVPILWNVLLNNYHVHINFAHQTFKWNSESKHSAAVHCVIVGFATFERNEKKLYVYKKVNTEQEERIVDNINPYLLPAINSFVVPRKNALCNVPKMNFGNQPRDGGYFVIDAEEREEILKKEPSISKWLHPYIGAEEFIKGKERWCLWLKKAEPFDIKQSKILYEKVESVRNFRLKSKAKTTNGYAKVPNMFAQITQPDDSDYLIIPSVSSERRRYVPIGFMNSDIISSNAVQIVPNATLYHFGVLTSNVHMAWMRTVCGRLKSDYRYSKELVYNTFPWPEPTEEQKKKIEESAKRILEVRIRYKSSSMASLYDPVSMPRELSKAHEENDKAVMKSYGFSIRDMSEEDCVAELMKLYQQKI